MSSAKREVKGASVREARETTLCSFRGRAELEDKDSQEGVMGSRGCRASKKQ